jgi:hypothetical protein
MGWSTTQGFHPDTICQRAAKGVIRIYRRGSMSFVKTSDVSAYIESLEDRLEDRP